MGACQTAQLDIGLVNGVESINRAQPRVDEGLLDVINFQEGEGLQFLKLMLPKLLKPVPQYM